MKSSNNEPRPEEFIIGSLQSKAAARLLAGKRKAVLIPAMVIHVKNVAVSSESDAEHEPKEWNIDDELSFTGMAIYSPLNAETMGNTPACWMTRQELRILEARQREYEKRCAIESDATRRSEKEVCDPAALDEKKPGPISPTADAAPQETEPEPKRAPIVESRLRPVARKPPYRRHWWPPSAYGL